MAEDPLQEDPLPLLDSDSIDQLVDAHPCPAHDACRQQTYEREFRVTQLAPYLKSFGYRPRDS